MSDRLEIAGRALLRPLCNHCLGRLFASVSRGLSNDDRGTLTRASVNDAPRPPDDISDCYVCRGLFGEIEKFAGLATKASKELEFSTFLVGTKVDPETVEREESFWTETGAKETESIKAELNREIGKALEKGIGKTVDFANPDMVFLIDTMFDRVILDIAPLFVYGRYRKYSRELPQTRWPCRECRGKGCPHCNGKGRMYDSSVQDMTGPIIMAHAKGEDDFFHGMGREDIDARMLGNGRPFVVEVRRPRVRTLDLGVIEQEINAKGGGLVDVSGLRMSTRTEMRGIKESTHSKSYRVRVRFQSEFHHGKLNEVVTSLAGKPISQHTPNRVVHRRADLERIRTVRSIVLEEVRDLEAVFVVEADSGTYIKELMHGDGGRTEPSVAGIVGVPCEVLELDVIGIGDQGE
ncbi:MAG TPA: tRNA pseudouridine(54/55) synthase Pus10 [Thermoplasmata archaeon]|jgi:tRNA pseudouridine synthase 10